MKNKSFGLDIGTTTIKAVWLTEEKNTFLLNNAAIFPTPAKGILSESPIDQDMAADALKKSILDAKITTSSVNIALPESQVYTKVIEMPVLSDKELSTAIYYEAEQYIPVSLDTITLDWKVLQRPQNARQNERMNVLLVGAPTVLIDRYQKIITKAGFTISAIETEILSAIRALIYPTGVNLGKPFPPSMILHIGAISTAMAIVKNETIVFTYSIPTGGTAINRAIASDFGFSLTQAEEYKKVYGMSKDAIGGKIGQATTPILMSIVSEVKKAITYYNQKYNDESPVAQILLSGGNAKLSGIELFFAEQCGLQTAIANPWHILKEKELPRQLSENAPEYTIAIGLAMRTYE